MSQKDVKFYLYRITSQKGKSIKNEMFEPVLNISNLADRHVNFYGERVTLKEFTRENDWVFGQMYRSQFDAVDEFLAGKSGKERPIPRDSDEEGITGKTHFLYVPECDILVLQGGRKQQIGSWMMVKYFAKLSKITGPIDIRPTMTVNQYEKYKKMREINYITVSLEKPDKGTYLKNSTDFPGRVVEELTTIGAFNVSLRFAKSKKASIKTKTAMIFDEARSVVDCFIKMHEEKEINLTTLKVEGSQTIEDPLEEVDFIRDRMKYTKKDVMFDEKGPSSYDCYMGCREAYNHFEKDILSLYRSRN